MLDFKQCILTLFTPALLLSTLGVNSADITKNIHLAEEALEPDVSISKKVDTSRFTKLRDPTRPLAGSGHSDSQDVVLVLQAILDKGGVRKAIINGKVLSSGDVISSRKITKIESASVTYFYNGSYKKIKLRPTLFK